MHALTLVLNPNARRPRMRPPSVERMKDVLGPQARIHITRDLEELDRFMRTWTYTGKGDPERATASEETLCFYGGDGSIARGLTSLIRHQGEDFPLPSILAVRAGTINMLCSILGFHESVDCTLGRWSRRELIGTASIPMIKVQVEGEAPQYGFIFSWGVGYRVLRSYYRRRNDPNVWDGMVVAAQTFLTALHPRANSHPLFQSEDLRMSVNGTRVLMPPIRSLAVGTIARVSLGLRPFPPVAVEPGGFHLSANAMSIFKVAWHSPSLLLGWGDQRKLSDGRQLVAETGVRELSCELSEGFTMDGEMFEFSSRKRVRITPGPVVRFWTRFAASNA